MLPWDHLDSGLDRDWLWEDWQDAAHRDRGRGLPLDAVLRLRRLPADGHRDPDRPDRRDAAPRSPCSTRLATRCSRRARRSERLARRRSTSAAGTRCSPAASCSTTRPRPAASRWGLSLGRPAGRRGRRSGWRRSPSRPPRRRARPVADRQPRLVAPDGHLPRAGAPRRRGGTTRRCGGTPTWCGRVAAQTPPLRWQLSGVALADRGVLALARAGRRRPGPRSGRRSCASSAASAQAEAALPAVGLVVDPAALRRAGRRPGRAGRLGRRPAVDAAPSWSRPTRVDVVRYEYDGVRTRAGRPSPRRRCPAYRRSCRWRARLTDRRRRRPSSGCGMRYAKRGRLRFTSHRDFQRAFERALRRAARADGLLGRLHPAPEDLLRRRRADRGGQRGGVPRDRAGRSAATPSGCGPRSTRRCRRAWTCSRSSRSRRPERRRSLADRLEASVWEIRLAGVPDADGARRPSRAFLAADAGRVERMTKNGLRTFDARAAVLAPDRRLRPSAPTGGGRPAVCDTATGRTARHTGRPTRRRPRRTRLDRRPGAARRPPRSPGWRKARSTRRPARCPTHWHRTGTPSAPEPPLRRPGCEARRCTTRLRRTSARAAGRPRRQLPRGARSEPGPVVDRHGPAGARERDGDTRMLDTEPTGGGPTDAAATEISGDERRRRRRAAAAGPPAGRPGRRSPAADAEHPATDAPHAPSHRAGQEGDPEAGRQEGHGAAEPASTDPADGSTGVAEQHPATDAPSAEPPPAKKATREAGHQEVGRRRGRRRGRARGRGGRRAWLRRRPHRRGCSSSRPSRQPHRRAAGGPARPPPRPRPRRSRPPWPTSRSSRRRLPRTTDAGEGEEHRRAAPPPPPPWRPRPARPRPRARRRGRRRRRRRDRGRRG